MEVLAVSVTAQLSMPLHPPPDHPAKVEPLAAAAVSVTFVPDLKLAVQVEPQSMPEGLLVTVPVPLPPGVTVSMKLGILAKVAFTVESAVTVTSHFLVPLHPSPDQPLNDDPAEADAVRVTIVPSPKLEEHWLLDALHLMPAGLLTTWPVPVPVSDTFNVKLIPLKFAVTLWAAFMFTTQEPVPLHAPPQPAKVDVALGVAVSVTWVPCA
jgi:hypothetical protein